jgi:hypothetical protein
LACCFSLGLLFPARLFAAASAFCFRPGILLQPKAFCFRPGFLLPAFQVPVLSNPALGI